MTKPNEPLRMLAPTSFRQVISRRALFQIGGAAAGLAILAACGSDDEGDSGSSGTTGGTTAGTHRWHRRPANCSRSTAT